MRQVMGFALLNPSYKFRLIDLTSKADIAWQALRHTQAYYDFEPYDEP
jgi:hypothetical protein